MTFHDLKWPWKHAEGSLVSIFRLRVSSLLVNRCFSVSNGFLPKEAPFIFLPLAYNGEVAKLAWPCRSRISKFRDIYFIDTGTDINRWKFPGDRCSYDEHWNLFWGHLTWPGDLTLSDLGLKCLHVRKRCINSYTKRHRCVPQFF